LEIIFSLVLIWTSYYNPITTQRRSGFAYHVSDPERYGVVEFDHDLNAVSIEENP
jgi:dTDP-glucose pyrophosphorylase